jgi:hypothetical protein
MESIIFLTKCCGFAFLPSVWEYVSLLHAIRGSAQSALRSLVRFTRFNYADYLQSFDILLPTFLILRYTTHVPDYYSYLLTDRVYAPVANENK